MKTELTLENKAKFFAQYICQRLDENFYRAILRGVFQKSKYSTDWWINTQHLELPISDIILPLTPLSSISDEDLDFLFNAQSKLLIPEKVGGLYEDHIMFCDYLRSKGYALPWMGLSVEEMVEAGWIKLQSE